MNDSVYNINETFIIEGIGDDTPIISACTALYSNELISCTGDTFIRLGIGTIYFNGDLYTNDNLSANTINASTYLSGGTNLFNIIQLTEITGGTYNINSGVLSLKKGNNSSVNISGINNYYTTGATLVGNVAYFNRNDALSAYTLDLTTLIPPTPFDVFVTGGTYSNGAAVFINNTGGTFTVSGFYTGATDVFVTGGTYSNGTTTFTNNTGGTFTINGFYTGFTGGSVSGLTATTISATTYQNLPLDVYTTGVTLNNSNYELTMTRNDGQTFGVNLGILSSDVTITGGSYNINTGVVTFTNNTGGTFSVSGFSSGMTDTSITNFTYNNNNFVITDSTGGTFNASINSVTGLTSNGTISSNVLSATTYQNLPIDIRVTGGTYSNGTTTFINNTGGTFNVSGFYTGFTGGNVSGLTATTISATTYQNLPLDIRVTGGTYNNSTGTATFTNNTGGTFTVSGLFTGSTDVFVTGATYSNNNFTFRNNTGGTFSVLFNTVTGLTSNGTISSSIFSATTYQNLPIDIRVTGGTYNSGTGVATFTNNTGGTFTVNGFSTGGGSTFTGGTVNGATTFTSGLSATTISATTYLGLPLDIRVTGGTYNSVTGIATFTNNSGGTFNVTGFNTSGSSLSGAYLPLSGGTVTGGTVFTNGVTANTISNLTNILFNLTAATTHTEGQIHWNDSTKTLEIDTDKVGVSVEVGQNNLVRVVNKTGSPLTKGTIVYIDGAQGNRPTVTKASYEQDNNSARTLGFITADIPDNQNGYVTTYGLLRDVNTLAYTAGTQLYLYTGGTVTNVKPVAPKHEVRLGYVITQNATTGIIFVYVMNGYEFTELHDVSISGQSNNDIPYWNSSLGVWKNTNSPIFTSLTASTISATTYQNLPLDIRVTGGTFNNNNGITTFTNNTGGTFTVNNFPTTGTTLLWTAGTNTHSVAQLGGNNIASGAYSLAVGSGTTASGDYSYAEGQLTISSGQFSHAEGSETIASGQASHAEGQLTTASGQASHAGGYNTNAYTTYSFATGVNSIASGSSTTTSASPITISSAITITLSDPTYGRPAVILNDLVATEWLGYYNDFCSLFTIYDNSSSQTIDCNSYTDIYEDSGLTYIVDSSIASASYDMISGDTFQNVLVTISEPAFAIGNGVKAYGASSFAEGYQTTASGGASHAEGYQTTASGDYSHAEGLVTIAGGYVSHAEGGSTTASGAYSHAEGYATTASGAYSHAEGGSTTASGAYSHAEGYATTASGAYSHAEGAGTIASGSTSHAEGYQTTASGDYSHAGGINSIASGNTSFVHGSGSIAGGANTIVLGANITGNTANTTYVDNLNIKTLGSGSAVRGLGIDINGFVVSATTSGSSTFTGGTVSGATQFTNGLTANTISATTYLGLPTDIRVTGGTYTSSAGTATFTNNTGGTFSVTGFLTGDTFTTFSSNGTWAGPPADSTSFYVPISGGLATPLTVITTFLSSFAFPVTIFGINVQHLNNNGVVGSGENVAIQIRNNTTSASTQLINIQTNQAVNVIKTFETYSLNVPIPANNSVALQINTPAWNPNPTNLVLRFTLFFQKT